jgi:ankyrin repeat protein
MMMAARWNRLVVVALAGLLIGAGSARLPLIDAARNSDSGQLRTLLQGGARVDAAEGDGTTALHWASYRDDLTSADLLIKAGANVNAANDLGATPLWTASQNGSAAMVKRLLQAGANPNLALLAGETPLMVASRVGNAEVVEQLLAQGAQPNVHGPRGQTALMWAVAQAHPDVVKVLLAHGADVHARSDTWNEVMGVSPHGLLEYNQSVPHGGDTALMFAMRVGDLESARLLVAGGADINDEDAWGVTATVLAAHSGFRDIVLFLLDKGADPNRTKAGFSALHEAIMRRDGPLVAALLDHGADPNCALRTWTPTRRTSNDFNFPPPLVGATPVWLAARFSEPAIARRLIEYGADPFFVHRADYTTLSEQAGYDHHLEATTILMAATGMGGRVNSWVPLQADREKREALVLESVKLAVELGVDVNMADPTGRTALDAAKGLKYDSVVSFLVEHGAVAGKPAKESSF